MKDRDGNEILPGMVVMEVGGSASVPPMIVLTGNRLLSIANVGDLESFPPVLLDLVDGEVPFDPDHETPIGSYDLYIVKPEDVDWASYMVPEDEEE